MHYVRPCKKKKKAFLESHSDLLVYWWLITAVFCGDPRMMMETALVVHAYTVIIA
jgi:hypothetical protein